MPHNNPETEARAKELLSRMTIEEKVAQMGSVWSFELLDSGRFSTEKAGVLIKNGIGHVARPGFGTGLDARQLARFNNKLQEFPIKNTRLGIPAIVHEECLSGFMARKATIFPQMIGIASSWDPDLLKRITTVIRMQMRAAGVHQGLGPVLDVARDPRWGRIEETFGEDPHLVATMGTAFTKGLQGDDLKTGVVATLKHFAGYGIPEGGLNWAPASIPERMLRDIYLQPFRTVIDRAGALSVMNAYNELDGIPCAALSFLLTQILRKEWGFEGTVISDYYAVENLHTYHRVASDEAHAARLAAEAGIDVELPKLNYYSTLVEQVRREIVPQTLLDMAVLRILKLKLRLGLFENPYVDPGKVVKIFDLPEHRELALDAARKSIVFLKNDDDLFPLRKDMATFAVIGPSADSKRNLLGDYTYQAHMPLIDLFGPGSSDAFHNTHEVPEEVAPHIVTVLQGITAKVAPKTRILYARGCDTNNTTKDGFEEAIAAAQAADVAILVIGGKSGLTPDCTCGEMRDSALLTLPGVQEDLVETIYGTGTPIVLVPVNGRPLALGRIKEKIPAIIMGWLPGEEGGNAIADVLFGDYNPSGKLPVTFPQTPGQIPLYYSHKPSGARSQLWGDYADLSTAPAFEFGYGLSYASFQLSNLQRKPTKVSKDDMIKIAFDITNTSERAGEDVVQLYISDVVASVTRPVKELKSFKRIALEPSETRTVMFELPVASLAFHNKHMQLVVEPGIFEVMVGHSSKQISLKGQFEVVQ